MCSWVESLLVPTQSEKKGGKNQHYLNVRPTWIFHLSAVNQIGGRLSSILFNFYFMLDFSKKKEVSEASSEQSTC